jgi:hypothetical protein
LLPFNELFYHSDCVFNIIAPVNKKKGGIKTVSAKTNSLNE